MQNHSSTLIVLSLLLLALLATFTVECTSNGNNKKDVIVLVHGAWHKSTIWSETVRILEKDYEVEAIVTVNLPGRMENEHKCSAPLSPQDIGPLAGYYAQFQLITHTTKLKEVIDSVRNMGNVHVVGHSMGGAYLQNALATINTTGIKTAVFSSSYLTKPGRSILEYTQLDPEINELIRNLVIPFENSPMLCVNTGNASALFYDNRCNGEAAAVADLVYEPSIPIVTPLANNLASLRMDQYYVRTLQDRALPLKTQNTIISEQLALGNRRLKVVDMTGGHTPQLCKAQQYSKLLANLFKLKKKKKNNNNSGRAIKN